MPTIAEILGSVDSVITPAKRRLAYLMGNPKDYTAQAFGQVGDSLANFGKNAVTAQEGQQLGLLGSVMANAPQYRNALPDRQFYSDVGRGLLDTTNRGVIGGLLGAPVDITTMLLRPLGYNVEKPVGGSEWIGDKMQAAGMVSPQRNALAETLSAFVDPATAAAAPAKALAALKGNALAYGLMGMAPIGATYNSQTMSKYFKDIDSLKAAIPQEGAFVRWSRGPKFDMKKGAASRDFVSGETHNGLSAVPISPDMSAADIAKYAKEYGFLRMKDPKIQPSIYRGKQVGIDSDGYALINPIEHIGSLDASLIQKLDGGLASELKKAESISQISEMLKKTNDPIGRKILEDELAALKAK